SNNSAPSLAPWEARKVAECSRSLPALETAKILQFEILELHEFTEVQSRFGIAIIKSGEFRGLGAQVDEGDVRLVPILKWQFALDAAIMRGRDDGHSIGLVVPSELLADMNLGWGGKILRFRRGRERVFALSVRQPGACAVLHHDVPLIPAALIV